MFISLADTQNINCGIDWFPGCSTVPLLCWATTNKMQCFDVYYVFLWEHLTTPHVCTFWKLNNMSKTIKQCTIICLSFDPLKQTNVFSIFIQFNFPLCSSAALRITRPAQRCASPHNCSRLKTRTKPQTSAVTRPVVGSNSHKSSPSG